MTVSTTATKDVYIGNDVTTFFTITFDFLAEDDVEVYELDPLDLAAAPVYKVRDVDYTVFVDASRIVTTYTPVSGIELHIVRAAVKSQSTSLPPSGTFPSTAVEGELDRGILVSQDAAPYRFAYPSRSAVATSALTTSNQAVYSLGPFSVPSGLNGTVLGVFGLVQIFATAAGAATEQVIVELHNGPLGTVSDPADVDTQLIKHIGDLTLYDAIPFIGVFIRVDDGDFLTVGVRRSSATGSIDLRPSVGGFIPYTIDFY